MCGPEPECYFRFVPPALRTVLLFLLVLPTSAPIGACRSSVSAQPDAARGPIAVGSIEPANGTPKGGNLTFISGENFDPRAPVTVMFGDKTAPRAVVVTRSRIQVQVPEGTPKKSVPVSVKFPTGELLSVKGTYYYGFPEEEGDDDGDHGHAHGGDAAKP